MARVEPFWLKRNPRFGRAPREIVFRQIRPVDGRRGVVAQHDDLALIALPAEHVGRGEPRRAAAENDDPPGIVRGRAGVTLKQGALRADERLALPLFRPPRVERTERRRSERLARTEIETGVVPGAADRLVDHESVREGTVVVGAVGADGEDLPAAARQEDRFLADMPEQLAVVGKLVERHAQRQVWPDRTRLIRHRLLPDCAASRGSPPGGDTMGGGAPMRGQA